MNFTKMHGLGNDFVVIDGITQSVSLSTEQVRFIADRHFGVGCDQLLLVEKSDVDNADFRYRIYNGDGEEVEHCGNGARCFAIFVKEEGLTAKTEIPVITKNGRIILIVKDDGAVTVDMGVPILEPSKIPFVANEQSNSYMLDIDGELITIGAISVGNPHAVILVEDIDSAPVEQMGKAIQAEKYFPNSVNVGFMQIIDRGHVNVRVYERGMGETQACGTGACAAIISGHLQGFLDNKVDVNLLGGKLSISWAGGENTVMMTGPTATVFKGTITL
ncbi:MAG: diaminopimelate epimerase [Cocleimonas sp.]|nr:diaminopimelate epimerase [Cocleimonas sp.]